MAIVIKEVSHKYNEFENKLSINNISLELEKNNIFGIIGKSGSGKTTLLDLIAVLIKLTFTSTMRLTILIKSNL